MLSDPRIRQRRREAIRASILQVLNVSRPAPCSESLLCDVIDGTEEYGVVSFDELRRELDYLEDKKLVRIVDRKARVWLADLTAYGVDVVEGSEPLPAGIAKIRFEV